MRLPTQHRLLIAIALSRMVGFSHAENPEKAFARSLCPQNADLIALIGGCSMWATTTRDLELKKRGGRYEKTTYHIVCQGTISSYSTEMPFHHTSSVQLSPGGSVLVNNGSVLISARDAATSTNSHLLHRVNFMSDCRNFEGWTFELEDPEPAEKIASTDPAVQAPASFLRIRTSRKTGCRIPLFKYAATNVCEEWRQGDWKRTWPIRGADPNKEHMVIWDGRGWQHVRLVPLSRVVADMDIDYLLDDSIRCGRRYRLNYRLESDGSRKVSKIAITMDSLISWVHNVPQVAPAISPLAEKDIRETEELLKTLPPSTGEGLTNWMVQVTYSDGKKWMPRMFIRTYPCRAVPPSVLRLLELMGGFQYEAKEILKEEPNRVKME